MRKTFLRAATTLIAILLFEGKPCLAEFLQVVHTNDLHSLLEPSVDKTRPGYARLKFALDSLKLTAASKGVRTLTLDAGDFAEGSPFYLVDGGAAAWQTLNLMGYDAVVIGNHDWLAGASHLDKILGSVAPNFALLGANFSFHSKFNNLSAYFRPYIELTVNDVRIAVIGLTTDEPEFSWLIEEGSVSNPAYSLLKHLPYLRKNNDFVFVLSHLGKD
ncbi:MAG: hypothetical protein A3K03_12695, partial [Bdellovibrionales bacterium RIFOXYD1_FULL_44_7]